VGAEGQSWGVDGWVGVARHPLSMVGTQGVSAEGGVSVFVFEGLGQSALFLSSVSLVLLLVGGGIS
jgi:hypothetical protein